MHPVPVDAVPAATVYVARPAHPTHPRTEEFLAEVRKAVSAWPWRRADAARTRRACRLCGLGAMGDRQVLKIIPWRVSGVSGSCPVFAFQDVTEGTARCPGHSPVTVGAAMPDPAVDPTVVAWR